MNDGAEMPINEGSSGIVMYEFKNSNMLVFDLL